MQNVGLWWDVSHLLQKQQVFLVVKSCQMWVSEGGGLAYIYIYMYVHTRTQTVFISAPKLPHRPRPQNGLKAT